MDKELNAREKDVLQAIKDHISRHGYPPTVREIGQVVGLKSSSTVHSYIHKLENKGFIRLDHTKPRAIEVLDKNKDQEVVKETVIVPLLGQVAAGLPILAEENLEDMIPLPVDFAGHGDIFMLRIKGDSMLEAGIFDGDLVLIKSQPTVNNGEICIAMIDNEATCKKFYKEKDYIRLEPANSYYLPIIAKDVNILGKVIGLLRRI
ncbi:transcriptional repressor LexA [Desulfoscipio gibsoniae]|uniref:LexA repressor n=1 Tax=Desulfoscipio gibsoniae DSM 7213 TaxID=767817 RepID=R4KHM2_9FIRM|nr:transcriptional repressor LexA [Desulfoscipio gibsoniae]AGL01152.1 SOS regulatory protein LexA [Desulfoscipio gibsoniae DSM 7213]